MRSAIDQISGMGRSARHDNLLIFRHSCSFHFFRHYNAAFIICILVQLKCILSVISLDQPDQQYISHYTSVDQPTVISIESEQISRSARHDYSLTFSDLDKSILVVKLYLVKRY